MIEWILACLLILSSLGVILSKNPMYSSLSFFLTLMTLALIFLELSAQFIAVMQILVYAGAILVIFVFVISLFQDAYQHIALFKPQTSRALLYGAALSLFLTLLSFSYGLRNLSSHKEELPDYYGTVQSLGKALYIDYFFPFEAIILLFLVALVGTLYIGKKT